MNPGKLDRRITIQAPTFTRDALGGANTTYSDYRTVWAQKQDVGGTEVASGEALRSSATTIFTVYFINELTTAHRILYGGIAHNILAIRELGRREYQEITCQVMEGGA